MDLNNVGRSGLKVSTVGLGCNNFGMRLDKDGASVVVDAALEAGITFFDTSDSYGAGVSEEYLGAALGQHRDDVVVATKFSSRMGDGPYRAGSSRKYVMRACEASLQRLGTDYIDLYYQHRPDPSTPIDETLDALDDLVRAGKVRYIASSNFAGWQIAQADHIAGERARSRFIASQSQWSLLERGIETEIVPACAAYGIGVVPYFPLASGLLTGKYRRGAPPPPGTRLASSPYFARWATDSAFDTVDRLAAAGGSIGRSLLEVSLGWLAQQETVASVLVGATTPEQVAANAAAVERPLTPDELKAVDEASTGAAPAPGA